MRVLIVDDEPHMRLLLRTWLEPDGWVLGEAASGEEAVERALAEGWDRVVVDMRLGAGMDGLATARALRERGFGGAIFVCSADVGGALAREAAAAGAEVADKADLDRLRARLAATAPE